MRFRNVVVTRIPDDEDAFASTKPLPSPSDGALELPKERFVMPVVKRQMRPRYPKDMLSQKIEGVVLVEVVISSRGIVEVARVKKNASPDFDAAAVAAAKQWLFAPATLDGEPVPMIATIELTFTIGK